MACERPNAGTYTIDHVLNITCTASDALSGIPTVNCPAATKPAYQYSVGSNALNASATDKAGNTASASATFMIVVNAGSLTNLTTQFLSDQSLATAYASMLQAVARAIATNNLMAKQGAVTAYINAVSAQAGNPFTPIQAAILVNLAKAL